ncbi:uncharacterized protein LOC128883846 isoform X2 [Hylaeus volcanicus]|uniref:uncharacterized protein LOC128883846 isoform X2 n=1 Tax=Hylaeus volcanicus TaxID=313075 RepID=UPI0023B83432|nr:uncharacterized protein LOC128883846 isoform X2 [Hylaeus volcanicus]
MEPITKTIINTKRNVFDEEIIKPCNNTLCQVCFKNYFKYTCPRCELLYCSLNCYTNHSRLCTEAFFQAQIVDRLLATKPSEDDKRTFERKLQNFYSEWKEDENKTVELARNGTAEDVYNFFTASSHGETEENVENEIGISDERIDILTTLSQQDAIQLTDLTPCEKQMFYSWLKRTKGSGAVEPWFPWWNETIEPYEKNPFPSHDCCSTTKPNLERIQYSIVQFLFGFCWILRRFNGDLESSNMHDVLTEFGTFAPTTIPPETALQTVNLLLSNSKSFTDDSFSFMILYDVICILTTKWKTIRALQELYTIIYKAYCTSRKEKVLFLLLIGTLDLSALKGILRKIKQHTCVCWYHMFNDQTSTFEKSPYRRPTDLTDIPYNNKNTDLCSLEAVEVPKSIILSTKASENLSMNLVLCSELKRIIFLRKTTDELNQSTS